jgi:hypothetical protein
MNASPRGGMRYRSRREAVTPVAVQARRRTRVGTYAHVIHELRGAPQLSAEQKIARAREGVAERGLGRLVGEAIG